MSGFGTPLALDMGTSKQRTETNTMASKSLFSTLRSSLAPKTDSINEAGGQAYQLKPRHVLAQYAATGCLNRTFYATAEDQLQQALKLCEKVPTDFIARTALHCRQKGFMKDVPALLCAVLAARDAERLELIFDLGSWLLLRADGRIYLPFARRQCPAQWTQLRARLVTARPHNPAP